MDNRSKIGAPLPPNATIVRGVFDPLLAAHARSLAALGHPLAVQVVDDAADTPPLLPLEARQILVAALSCVDAVIPPGVPAEPHHDWTQSHQQMREEFIRHVHQRSSAR